MATEYKLSYTASEIDKKLGQIDNLAAKDEIPTKTSQLTNDSGFITGYTETDPTVPAWAKSSVKPSYSKSEVGLGNVDNVKQYSASNPPPYPVTSINNKTGAVTLNASDVGARPSSWTPSYSDVGAEKSGTAAAAVSSHNTSTSAHNDIRLLVDGLSSRVNALANSTDEDLDQMAEIVAYIKNNKTLIDNVTTSKVNVADIINNLTTNVSNKPLSAAQGVALKALIDALENDKLDASALSTAISTALAQAKSSGEFDGEDGVSATHKWNGTVLTVTSASGTSSADLKGNKGDSGVYMGSVEPTDPNVVVWVNPDGEADSLDYILTDEDKNEIADIVKEKVPFVKIAESPIFANSIEECTDTTKLYVLPDGYIYAYMLTEVESGPSYTNLLPKAINADGTPYVGNNGEKGYKTGWRLNSSRVEKEAAGRCCTGFIPVKNTDTVRFKNIKNDGVNLNGYIYFYANDFTTNGGIMYEYAFDGSVFTFVPNNIKGFNSANMDAGSNCAYMRVSTHIIDDTSIITVNEEIVEGGTTTTGYVWANTGHAFTPADYEDRIIDVETDVARLKTRVSNLEADNDNSSSGTVASDSVEILLPSEAVAVVGVEFNVYHKSIIRASRPVEDFDVKCYLSNNSVTCRRYAECFRMTADADDVGDYTFTVEVRNLKDYAVVASKSMTLHIIDNTAVTGKNVLFIGDSLTFSRAGLYSAEIQYNLSNGGMVSIGTQNGSVDTNQVGNVKHEGYNGATVGGFLKANVTSAFTNPFYNPTSGTFDLAYFMTNNGYSKVDAVCLNLGHNNLGNEVAGVNDLKTIIQKIHDYDASIPVIVSLIAPLGDQNSHAHLGFSAGQMRYHWRQLIKAYITAFDNGNISNVYLSTPYFNVDQDNDLPTETVARCARDNTQIVRQNDSMHPTRIGTLKMADSYYANLLYHLR